MIIHQPVKIMFRRLKRFYKGLSKTCGRGLPPPSLPVKVNYPDLTDRASQFIETLTSGILFKYSTIAEAFSSPGVSPAFHRQSPFGHQ